MSPSQTSDPAGANDRVMLITGASSGIGAATSRRASREGYRLVLAARSQSRLAALAEELGDDTRTIAVKADVNNWPDLQAATQVALDTFGRLDVVFANAGVGATPGFQAETPEYWREMILTNVYGAALTIRATVDALRASQGHLLLTGSVAGRIVYPGSLYSCTKWAVTAMGEAARLELQGSGVRVTLIEPGVVDTPFFPEPEPVSIDADDIAAAVLYALAQPPQVDVNEIVVRPTYQAE
jgi:NADP-dependent 3-hydroxy acid dehydrogenase YdfG